MEQLLDSILAVAKLAAADAGALMRAHVGRVAVEHEKGAEPRDLVTLVDAACQAAIAARVSSAFPLHSFLGEEDIEAGSAASAAAIRLKEAEEWLWICDPIDGTTNFVSGVPFSCVSIGVAYFGVIQCGVILDPYREEMFFSVRNRGAWLASGTQPPRRLSVSTETLMRNALFAYGLHHSKSVAHTMLRGVQAVTDVSRGARSLGSAALHMVGQQLHLLAPCDSHDLAFFPWLFVHTQYYDWDHTRVHHATVCVTRRPTLPRAASRPFGSWTLTHGISPLGHC